MMSSIMNPFFHLAPLFTQTFIWLPTRLVLELFGRVKIEGLDNLKPIKGNVIFAMNHSSEIDPFLVPACLPMFSHFLPLFYATKGRDFYDNSGWRKYMFGGLFINFWGGHTVVSGVHDYKVSLKNHLRLADEGESFVVFPEGGITRDGNLRPAHGGVAFLAEYAGCPVVPVAVSGVYGMSARDFFGRKRKIMVRLGKPIYQTEFKGISEQNHTEGENIYKKQAEYVMDKIKKMMVA